MRSSNPAFSSQTFTQFDHAYGATRGTVMTVQGTVGKTFGLLGILSATAIWSWQATLNDQIQPGVLGAAAIGGFVLALITIFKPTAAPWTAPVYAAFEGVFLGMLSCLIENRLGHAARGNYAGIAMQAVSLTGATLFMMLFAYTTGLIRVTERLRAGVVAATGAVCLFYFVTFLLRMFGVGMPSLWSPSPFSIGISVVVVGIAAFNLLLDFDFIEQGARAQVPKYMEWYGAFGLLVTLIWLYLEILRLLTKLQDRR
ncbi:MAG: Bax inhibitor-1/YccA family protein [Isosphaeraceae bacterium]|nr:Bax inhibitor-1/YccA family protein [Isosphaeraceae bacterium]